MSKYIVIFIFLSISCRSRNYLVEKGFIQLKTRVYSSADRQYTKEDIMPDMNIWYNGNLVIEEIKIINENIDSTGSKKETPVAYYLFMDRNRKRFYHYSSFSDTAKILDSYTLADTSDMRGLGGWGFYKNLSPDIIGRKESLADTIINGIIYKRVHFKVKEGNRILPTIRYLRCDKKESLFRFNKSLSEDFGCPIVRVDYLLTPENPIPISSEIVFVRNNLSKEESRVFDAWDKNMKQYPIK